MSKLTFAEKLKMQNEGGSPEVQKVEEQVEAVEKPKKERKPRKKAEKKVEETVSEEVVEQPKRKPRKKQEVVEGGSVEKPVKEKRPPSAYNLFVKNAYKSKEVQKLPPKERFAKVAELWHKEKTKKSKK